MINTEVTVNTFAKYNRGVISLLTIDPAKYESESAFYARCKEMHSDESNPELLFTSVHGLPSCVVDEFGLNWDLITKLKHFEEEGKGAAFITFLKAKGESDIKFFDQSYIGMAEDQVSALEIITDMDALLEPMPAHLRSYFDFDSYARDLFISEYDFYEGFVFRKY